MSSLEADVKATIRNIPDFPKPGILFKDITPILADASLMRRITDSIVQEFADQKIDVVIGMESRGFIFGVPVAMELGAAFVPARKPGKLPYDRVGVDYSLEYGTARLEIHSDAVEAGQRVLIVDDLLATGGTAKATVVRWWPACSSWSCPSLRGRPRSGRTPSASSRISSYSFAANLKIAEFASAIFCIPSIDIMLKWVAMYPLFDIMLIHLFNNQHLPTLPTREVSPS